MSEKCGEQFKVSESEPNALENDVRKRGHYEGNVEQSATMQHRPSKHTKSPFGGLKEGK